MFLIKAPHLFGCSFFESSEESESGDDTGETEDAIRQRIAKEFGFGEAGKGGMSEEEEGEEGGADDDDPLEAFMAGIEVGRCVSHYW